MIQLYLQLVECKLHNICYVTITFHFVPTGCDFISFIELNNPTTISQFELIQDGTSSQVEIEVRFPFGIQPGIVQEQAFFRVWFVY